MIFDKTQFIYSPSNSLDWKLIRESTPYQQILPQDLYQCICLEILDLEIPGAQRGALRPPHPQPEFRGFRVQRVQGSEVDGDATTRKPM
jgi:hypothetical protein